MPILASGSNVTLTVSAGQILTVQSDQATFDFESPVGTRVGEYASDVTFGPFAAAGSVKITSVQGPVFYDLANGPSSGASYVITGGSISGTVIDGLATQIPLLSSNTGTQNATTFAAIVNTSGGFALPGSGDFTLEPSDIPADSALIGNEKARLRTTPVNGKPWGLRFPQGLNNPLVDRVKMTPAAGAATHDGIVSELMNGAALRQPAITSYTGACSIRFANATAMRVEGGQFGNASDVAVALSGATNDCLFTATTIAYPKYGGYVFGPGGQANTVLGGETAVQDGGVPVIIDRSNSATFQNHNSESQATGGTPAAFYVIGNGTAMVSVVTITAAGSGYTDGVYYLTATGGTGSPPRVLATVSGGVVTATTVLFPGYGIGTGWTLAMPAASGGSGATFSSTLGTSTGTHNPHLRNLNIIANKGAVVDAFVVQSPTFGMVLDGVRINATQITGSIVKFNTTNAVAVLKDLNVSGRPGGVVDIKFATDATFLPAGASYTVNTNWDFYLNKGARTLLVGSQARAAFPTGTRAALRELEIAPDALIAPYLDRVIKNGATILITDANTGQVTQGNGTDSGQPWRNYGPLGADPTTLTDGDQWFRTDTKQLCVRSGGVTVRSAAFV